MDPIAMKSGQKKRKTKRRARVQPTSSEEGIAHLRSSIEPAEEGSSASSRDTNNAPRGPSVIDDWIRESTVKSGFPGVNMPRSTELRQVDAAVLALSRVRGGRPRPALDAAAVALERLRTWRKAKRNKDRTIRDAAVAKLDSELADIVTAYYAPLAEAMGATETIDDLPPGTVWLHGTDAVAEILASGVVLGGTVVMKSMSTDLRVGTASTETNVAQDEHFFMARTALDGTVDSRVAMNAYVKGKQAADAKLRLTEEPLASTKQAGRPLMGVIEFAYDPADSTQDENIRKISTGTTTGGSAATRLPLSDLEPLAIRVISEDDAVRILDFVLRTAPGQVGSLPAEIHVRTDPEVDPDLVTAGGDARATDIFRREVLLPGHDYEHLITQALGWRRYRTADVVAAIRAVQDGSFG